MSTPHRATPEQWNDLGAFASDTRACVLELRSRIEALEAVQQQVRQQVRELQTMHNTATDWQMEQDARLRALESRIARVAIRAMAAWLKNERESPFLVDLLVQEAER